MSKKLTDRQRRFVEEYLVDMNAVRAAIRAGYAETTARNNAYALFKNAAVREAVRAAMEARAARVQITQDRVIEELAALAFSDIGAFLTLLPGGDVALDWAGLPAGATRPIAEIVQDEYADRSPGGGRGADKRRIRRTRFKLHPKLPALEALAKHLGFFIDRKHVDVTGHLTLASEPLPATARWLEETLGGGTPGETAKPRPH
ncbi:MAG: terminase small subunit [Rhodospirillales bacterium]